MATSGVRPVGVIILIMVGSLPQRGSTDPDPAQDFCVADTNSEVFLNGVACIDPSKVAASQFKTSALGVAGNTSGNPWGISVAVTTTKNLPGANTQGLTLTRTDIAKGGVVPPHIHPRASEIAFVVKGNLVVGFVDTANNLFSQELQPGDVFVFPRALLHFLSNVGNSSALLVTAFNSQNPGTQIVAGAAFASKPPIPPPVLAKAFQISAHEVDAIRTNLGG